MQLQARLARLQNEGGKKERKEDKITMLGRSQVVQYLLFSID
jgi:hypothetical protein